MLIEHEGKRPRVAESAYVAPTAVVCGDVVIGPDSRILNSSLRPGTTVPIGWIAVGDPADLFAPDAHEELWPVQRAMDFPRTVFGLERAEATMERVSARYAEQFGRHRGDRVVAD